MTALICDSCGEPIEPGNGWVTWITSHDERRSQGLMLVHHLKGRREGAIDCQKWHRLHKAKMLPGDFHAMDHHLEVFTANGFERLFGLLDPDLASGGYAMDPADWLRVARRLLA